jgi:hypothetical protein
MVKLDKELYRKAYELHRQWNEAELVDDLRNAGKLLPQEAWRQYVDLWEFCMKLSPSPSELQEKQRASELDHYYANIRKFESWRRARGKTT